MGIWISNSRAWKRLRQTLCDEPVCHTPCQAKFGEIKAALSRYAVIIGSVTLRKRKLLPIRNAQHISAIKKASMPCLSKAIITPPINTPTDKKKAYNSNPGKNKGAMAAALTAKAFRIVLRSSGSPVKNKAPVKAVVLRVSWAVISRIMTMIGSMISVPQFVI